jgi:hypothetical protein
MPSLSEPASAVTVSRRTLTRGTASAGSTSWTMTKAAHMFLTSYELFSYMFGQYLLPCSILHYHVFPCRDWWWASTLHIGPASLVAAAEEPRACSVVMRGHTPTSPGAGRTAMNAISDDPMLGSLRGHRVHPDHVILGYVSTFATTRVALPTEIEPRLIT